MLKHKGRVLKSLETNPNQKEEGRCEIAYERYLPATEASVFYDNSYIPSIVLSISIVISFNLDLDVLSIVFEAELSLTRQTEVLGSKD